MGFLVAAAAAPVASQTERNGIFSMQIDTDKPVYRSGDDIKIRITIRNDTGQEYGLHVKAPWLLCDLSVVDMYGRIVQTTLPRQIEPHGGGADVVDFDAGRSYVPGYYLGGDYINGTNEFKRHDWTSVTSWGYELSYPGVYRIAAIAQLRGLTRPDESESFFTVTASNAVQIKIVR